MKIQYIKIYKPFVGNKKFQFTLDNIYDVVEYNISSQKMFIIKDDNGNQIKLPNSSRMMKHFNIINE